MPASSQSWPPADEPVHPATVAARLDELGWLADSTTVLEHTQRHALAAYNDGRNPTHYVIVNLATGRTIGLHYGTEDGAYGAWRVLSRRDTEDGGDR